MQVLFRMVDCEEGSVAIDGVDTKAIGLAALRSRLTIIPQVHGGRDGKWASESRVWGLVFPSVSLAQVCSSLSYRLIFFLCCKSSVNSRCCQMSYLVATLLVDASDLMKRCI